MSVLGTSAGIERVTQCEGASHMLLQHAKDSGKAKRECSTHSIVYCETTLCVLRPNSARPGLGECSQRCILVVYRSIRTLRKLLLHHQTLTPQPKTFDTKCAGSLLLLVANTLEIRVRTSSNRNRESWKQ